MKKWFLFLLMFAAGFLVSLTPLFDRPLWHDEAQVAYGAHQWLETGSRRFCDGQTVVGENLHHALNADGDLPLMSPMENWLAALGRSTVDDSGGDPWKKARWPFFLCGLLALGITTWGMGRVTGSVSGALLGGLAWGLNPWVWSLSVQLRYYPVVWMLVSVGVVLIMAKGAPLCAPTEEKSEDATVDSGVGAHGGAPLSHRASTRGGWKANAILLLLLYLTNWVVALCWVPLALLMTALHDRRRVSPMMAGFAVALGLMAWHASLGSDLAQWVLMLPDRASTALRVLAWHSMEFNVDVFPLGLLGMMVIGGWRWPGLRPLLAGAVAVVMLLTIPSFYTRLALMFLPLFTFSLGLWLWNLSAFRPVVAMTVGTLALGTYAFQVVPCFLASSVSERAARWSVPLTREAGRIFSNTREAWQSVVDPWPGKKERSALGACLQDRKDPDMFWPLEGLAFWLKSNVKDGEQVSCAMDGTALQLQTGLAFNWRVPEWGKGRPYAPNLSTPEGVKYVVVRSQHPFLTREVTWTNEILKGIEKGWLKGQTVTLPIEDVKFFNSPFPFGLQRQTWPKVAPLQVWVLDHPITAEEAQKMLPLRDRRLIRPQGVDPLLDPDEVWGLPWIK